MSCGLQPDCFVQSSSFQICLDLSCESGVSGDWTSAFISAREKWEGVIKSNGVNLDTQRFRFDPSFTANGRYPRFIDGVYIASIVEPIDGPYNILGSAGPMYLMETDEGVLPLTGTMRFDSADIQIMIRRGWIEGVIEHEMGHVLGIGT